MREKRVFLRQPGMLYSLMVFLNKLVLVKERFLYKYILRSADHRKTSMVF